MVLSESLTDDVLRPGVFFVEKMELKKTNCFLLIWDASGFFRKEGKQLVLLSFHFLKKWKFN